MTEPLYKIINKEELPQLGFSLRETGTIYAPVKTSKESHSFKQVDALTEADLQYNRTMIPPKKFFISPKETIFTFNKEKEEYKKMSLKACSNSLLLGWLVRAKLAKPHWPK